jgi:hypothetical protein
MRLRAIFHQKGEIIKMMRFNLDNKPETERYQKFGEVDLAFIDSPFEVETQEGILTISPETVDDWENGYYLAYPDDGTKPYAISPSFMRNNYKKV